MAVVLNDWYRHQRAFDAMARDSSEVVLGAEADIYAEAMGLTAQFIDATANRDDFNSLTVKRMLGAATHSFNLLCSAWDSTLTGRYGAAASHQRSINETPDLLKGLYIEPAFAEQMTGTESDVKRARRIVRDAYTRAGSPEAKTFISERQRHIKTLHPFSHLTFEAMGVALGIGVIGGQKVGVLRAGGAPAHKSLFGLARILALDAVELTGVVAVVLGEENVTAGPVPELFRKAGRLIGDDLDQEEILTGEMERFLLVRSDEKPPHPDRVPEVER